MIILQWKASEILFNQIGNISESSPDCLFYFCQSILHFNDSRVHVSYSQVKRIHYSTWFNTSNLVKGGKSLTEGVQSLSIPHRIYRINSAFRAFHRTKLSSNSSSTRFQHHPTFRWQEEICRPSLRDKYRPIILHCLFIRLWHVI